MSGAVIYSEKIEIIQNMATIKILPYLLSNTAPAFHQAHSFRCLIRLLLQAGCPSEAMIPSVILSECYKDTKMEIDNSLEFF